MQRSLIAGVVIKGSFNSEGFEGALLKDPLIANHLLYQNLALFSEGP